MAEASDRLLFVLIVTHKFHAAHRVHGLEVLKQFGLSCFRCCGGFFGEVGSVCSRELDGDRRFGRQAASRMGARSRGAAQGGAEHPTEAFRSLGQPMHAAQASESSYPAPSPSQDSTREEPRHCSNQERISRGQHQKTPHTRRRRARVCSLQTYAMRGEERT